MPNIASDAQRRGTTGEIRREDILATSDTTISGRELRRHSISPGPGYAGYVRANYDFPASRNDEIDLRRGAVYRVIAEQGPWLLGEDETATRRGRFPTSYVEWVAVCRYSWAQMIT